MRIVTLACVQLLTGICLAQSNSPVYVFSTLAGQPGTSGSADGRGSAARFKTPTGIAVDRGGFVFVADSENGTIRRITADGVVSTVAGLAGNFGSRDGVGASARFGHATVTLPTSLPPTPFPRNPPITLAAATAPVFQMGIAVDHDGNILVADTGNCTIRRVSPFGNVETLAGAAGQLPAYLDDVGSTARFNYPSAVCEAPNYDIMIAEVGNRTIRRLEPNGRVTTFAGAPATVAIVFPPSLIPLPYPAPPADGTGLAARFVAPCGLLFASTGDLLVLDGQYSGALRKITSTAVVSTLAGILPTDSSSAGSYGIPGSVDGIGNMAQFARPAGLVQTPEGELIIPDAGSSRIRLATLAGVVTTIAGSVGGSADGVGTDAQFRAPAGIALDSDGNLYIADSGNHTIRKGVRVRVPVIATQPSAAAVLTGQSATLSVSATSAVPATYQWRKDGAAISGGTSATLTIADAKLADAGAYTVVVSNPAGTTISNPAIVTVSAAATVGTITAAPVSQAVLGGNAVSLSVAVSGTPPFTYQWRRNGVDIPGATSATLTIPAVDAGDAGEYVVVVTNAAGTTTSAPAIVTVNTSRIANLSIRSNLTAPAPMLTVGFVVSGTGKTLLLRAGGPALGQFGLSGTLPDPRLGLFSGTTLVAANDNWTAASNAADITATAARIGAFGFPAGADAAMLATLEGGAYSAQVADARNGSGIVLVELYDANPSIAARLVNVSARTFVGTDDHVLVAGFVVTGNAPRDVLIRAVGPTLASFGVTGALADPMLEVFRAGAAVAEAGNNNWGGTSALKTAFASVGAFPFASDDSKDAAVVLRLEPGSYSAQVSGVGRTTGEALVEIYELPER